MKRILIGVALSLFVLGVCLVGSRIRIVSMQSVSTDQTMSIHAIIIPHYYEQSVITIEKPDQERQEYTVARSLLGTTTFSRTDTKMAIAKLGRGSTAFRVWEYDLTAEGKRELRKEYEVPHDKDGQDDFSPLGFCASWGMRVNILGASYELN